MEPRLREAQEGRRTVLFVDAAHFVFGSFLGYLWCVVRRWVRGASGRQRLSVLGALNAVTNRLTTVSSDSYINAETVCELLRRLRRQYGGQPITMFLDNARYQRCTLVRELAERLRIELQFLPPYSPNLNLIERFWKFVKKQCLYSKHYPDYAAFRGAILDCIKHAPRKHKAELRTLLAPNFQSFEKALFLTV
jgi:transposase